MYDLSTKDVLLSEMKLLDVTKQQGLQFFPCGLRRQENGTCAVRTGVPDADPLP